MLSLNVTFLHEMMTTKSRKSYLVERHFSETTLIDGEEKNDTDLFHPQFYISVNEGLI